MPRTTRKDHDDGLAFLAESLARQAAAFRAAAEVLDWPLELAADPLFRSLAADTREYALAWAEVWSGATDDPLLLEVQRACTQLRVRRRANPRPHPFVVLALAQWAPLYVDTQTPRELIAYPGLLEADPPASRQVPKRLPLEQRKVTEQSPGVWRVTETRCDIDSHLRGACLPAGSVNAPSVRGFRTYSTRYRAGIARPLRPRGGAVERLRSATLYVAAWALWAHAGLDRRFAPEWDKDELPAELVALVGCPKRIPHGRPGVFSFEDVARLLPGFRDRQHVRKAVARVDSLIRRYCENG